MKEIFFDTNFNNKMDCQVFLHISMAPLDFIPESKMGGSVRIVTRDGSHEPITCKLVDFARVKMNDLVSVDTYASYGLNEFAFKEWWFQKYAHTTLDSEMAIYVYARMSAAEEAGAMAHSQKEMKVA